MPSKPRRQAWRNIAPAWRTSRSTHSVQDHGCHAGHAYGSGTPAREIDRELSLTRNTVVDTNHDGSAIALINDAQSGTERQSLMSRREPVGIVLFTAGGATRVLIERRPRNTEWLRPGPCRGGRGCSFRPKRSASGVLVSVEPVACSSRSTASCSANAEAGGLCC
jgi:hypothetical protein